jgi:hypothetical protein
MYAYDHGDMYIMLDGLHQTATTRVTGLAHATNLVNVGRTPDKEVALALLDEARPLDPLHLGQALRSEVRENGRPWCLGGGSGDSNNGSSEELLLTRLVLKCADQVALRLWREEVDDVGLRVSEMAEAESPPRPTKSSCLTAEIEYAYTPTMKETMAAPVRKLRVMYGFRARRSDADSSCLSEE